MSGSVTQIDARAATRIGTTLHGKYKIARVLGTGGMAAVYLGIHRNGHRVAIKVLHAELSAHEDIRARFVREGYVANAVGHPGAVRVIDDDVAEDGAAFLVMEMLEGESLGQRQRRLGSRPCREVLAIGHQLLDVLAAAHEKGIVHRDIKPENLFLTTSGALKVLDFGIARIRHEPGIMTTQAGARLGTPAFMPPEQALGRWEHVDGRADLWACGATMFTLLTGRIVHEAETPEEVIVRVATQPARSLAAVAKDVPAEVVALVDRALSFSREDRFPDARSMQAAIEEAHLAVYGEPIAPTAIEDALVLPMEVDASVEVFSEPSLPTLDQPSLSTLDQPSLPTLDQPSLPTLDQPSLAPAPRAEEDLPPPAPPVRSRRWFAAPALALAALAVLSGGWFVRSRSAAPSSAVSAPASVAAPPGCTSHRACVTANGGKPALCRKEDGVCVPLETDECKVLASPGDVENEATIWFGAMFPFRVPDKTMPGPRSANAIELARRDFVDTIGGLPPIHPDGPRRPLAIVLCDDETNATRAAEHLVNDVRVPAILGFSRSKEVLDLATSLFLPKGVLALAANTATALRDIPHAPGEPRLVWRVTIGNDMQTPAQRDLLTKIVEPELRRTPGLLKPGASIRVAMARIANPSGQSVADALVGQLRFNDRNVTENGSDFRMFTAPDVGDHDPTAASSQIAAEIAAYQPHVILSAGMDTAVIPWIERAWPAHVQTRPRYIWDTAIARKDMLAFIEEHPEARKRMFFVETAEDNSANTKYQVHYETTFTDEGATSAPYDAFYLLAYATAALGDKPLTGQNLARAIPRLLPPGERIDVGPGGIYPVLYALASGKNVDLEGAQTTLDFDLEKGDATVDLAVRCFPKASAGPIKKAISSGLTFRAHSQAFEGKLSCP